MLHLRALIGVLAISFSAIFVRLADVSPVIAAFYRTAYALPVLGMFQWLFPPGTPRSWRQRSWAGAAGLVFGINLTIYHYTIGWIGAGLATVLGNTQVVFVGLAAWWLYGERPTSTAMKTVPAVFLGVVLVSGLGGQGAYGRFPLWGASLGLLAGMTYATYILLFRRANRGTSHSLGPLLDASFVSTLCTGLIGGFGFDLSRFVFHWPAHGWLLGLALIGQVGGWFLIGNALPKLPALETSVMILLQPMLTVIWGVLLFAEYMSWIQGLGMGIILVGLAVLTRAGASTLPPAGEIRDPAA